jgi:hypothetical protein
MVGLFVCVVHAGAQASSGSTATKDRAVLVSLAPPSYPQTARTAHISGDIVSAVKVGRDGIPVSAIVASGLALRELRETTLESVKQSRFECRACGDEPEAIRMVYSYQLDDPEPCGVTRSDAAATEGPSPYPRISHSGNQVTVIDRSPATCDPRAEVTKVRSIRCLYLWACSSN